MRTAQVEVLYADGWETVTFEEITKLAVVAGSGRDGNGLTLTLIGHRDGRRNQVEPQILDVRERHEPLLDGDVPRTPDGTAYPVALRSTEHTADSLSEN